MSETYVIVGAGAAGLAAVRAIRRRDKAGRIVVITAESCPSYSPALLPYLLAGKVDERDLVLADQRFYDAYHAVVVPGTRMVEVDFEERTIFVEPGDPIEYTKLLIATGASARGEEVPGAVAADGPLTLRTLADARILLDRLLSADSVAVLGAGLAGLEIAAAARNRGKEVTVIARSDQILSRSGGAEEAAIVQRWFEEAGIRVLLGRQPTALEPTGLGRTLTTAQGDAVPADLLVAAKGVIPNTMSLDGYSVEDAEGLPVDEAMRTGYPGVFAAGDVTRSRHAVAGTSQAIATWPSACVQGEVAGSNMSGALVTLAGELPWNVLPVLGHRMVFMGCTTADALAQSGMEITEERDNPRGSRGYRRLWYGDGRLIGAVLTWPYRDAALLRRAIESGVVSGRRDEAARSRVQDPWIRSARAVRGGAGLGANL